MFSPKARQMLDGVNTARARRTVARAAPPRPPWGGARATAWAASQITVVMKDFVAVDVSATASCDTSAAAAANGVVRATRSRGAVVLELTDPDQQRLHEIMERGHPVLESRIGGLMGKAGSLIKDEASFRTFWNSRQGKSAQQMLDLEVKKEKKAKASRTCSGRATIICTAAPTATRRRPTASTRSASCSARSTSTSCRAVATCGW